MEISTMGLMVGAIGAVLLVLLIATVVLHAKTLKIPVKLPHRRAYLAFDPDAYLYSISEGEFSRIAAMVEPSSRKKRLEVHWRYSTPSGKTTHHAHRRYSREWVEAYVEQLAGAFKSGQEKLLTLNRLYARALAEGKEVRDEHPTIYCYILPGEESHQGLIKIGYASGSAFKRIANQFKSAAHLEVDYRILTLMPAITITGEKFMDHKVHGLLRRAGIENPIGEWFRCTPEQAERAILAAQMNQTKVSLAS